MHLSARRLSFQRPGELALRRRSGDGRPGVDNLSVFFLAQGEQSADAVMARLTTFIRAAKQTLDLAVYDMRFGDPLRTQLDRCDG
jgi:hypothetical protein